MQSKRYRIYAVEPRTFRLIPQDEWALPEATAPQDWAQHLRGGGLVGVTPVRDEHERRTYEQNIGIALAGAWFEFDRRGGSRPLLFIAVAESAVGAA